MDVTVIGEKIKKRRAALGITQKELAHRLNVSNQLISKWETGESIPSLEYFDALCRALDVGYNYFTGEQDVQPAAVPETEERPQCTPAQTEQPNQSEDAQTVSEQPEYVQKPKRRFNLKLFLIISLSVAAALIIAGTAVLSVFVLAPAANKNRYINNIENSFENYFAQGYYAVNLKSELDGDVKNDYSYSGYLNDDGSAAYYNSKTGRTVADGILTFDGDSGLKYHFIQNTAYNSVGDLAFSQINDGDESIDEDLDDIKYIRKVKGGYYLEMRDEYFTDGLSGSQKKNYKILGKIKGDVKIENNIFRSMSVTVKYRNKPDNEDFTVKVTLEFISERPVIEHKNLDNRMWSDEIKTDKPLTSDKHTDVDGLISVLSDGASERVYPGDEFGEALKDDGVKDCGDGLYYIADGKAVIWSYDFKTKKIIELNGGNSCSNAYVYLGKAYYTDVQSGFAATKNMYVCDVTGRVEKLFDYAPHTFAQDDITYFGGYALYSYYNYNGEEVFTVYDLAGKRVLRECNSNENVVYVDSRGNIFFHYENSGSAEYPRAIIDGQEKRLAGTSFYKQSEWSLNYKFDGDSVYTMGGGKVFRYVYGELVEELDSSAASLKSYYRECTGGYFYIGIVDAIGGTGMFYGADGKKASISYITLITQDGEAWGQRCKVVTEVVNGKVLVEYGSYFYGVYGADDLCNPLCFARIDESYSWESVKVYSYNGATVVSVNQNDGTHFYVF